MSVGTSGDLVSGKHAAQHTAACTEQKCGQDVCCAAFQGMLYAQCDQKQQSKIKNAGEKPPENAHVR